MRISEHCSQQNNKLAVETKTALSTYTIFVASVECISGRTHVKVVLTMCICVDEGVPVFMPHTTVNLYSVCVCLYYVWIFFLLIFCWRIGLIIITDNDDGPRCVYRRRSSSGSEHHHEKRTGFRYQERNLCDHSHGGKFLFIFPVIHYSLQTVIHI